MAGLLQILGTTVNDKDHKQNVGGKQLRADLSQLSDRDTSQAITYQWYLDGASISGATNRDYLIDDNISLGNIRVDATYTSSTGQQTTASSPTISSGDWRIFSGGEARTITGDYPEGYEGKMDSKIVGDNPAPFLETYSKGSSSATHSGKGWWDSGYRASSTHSITGEIASKHGLTAQEGSNIIKIAATSNSKRAELGNRNWNTRVEENQDAFISEKIYLPKEEWDPVTEYSTIIFQHKQYPGSDPNFELRISNEGDYKLYARSPYGHYGLKKVDGKYKHDEYPIATLSPDTWHDLKIHLTPSQSSSKGQITIYLDGEVIFSEQGTNLNDKDDTDDSFLKLGMYTQINDKRHYFVDAVEMATFLPSTVSDWVNGTTTPTTPPTSDTTAPTFSSAATSTDGTKIVLSYNETLSSATASADHFTVKVDDSTATISSVATSGSNVELTLSSAVKNGQTVTVAYTDPSSNNDNNAIQDAAGNDASNLSTTAVTNQVGDTSSNTTTTLFASQDAAIKEGVLDYNGNFSNVTAYGKPGEATIALVEFDISSLSNGVGAATFRPYINTLKDNASSTFSIYSTTAKDWDENSVTWSTRPLRNQLLDTITITGTGSYVDFDVTNAITAALQAGQSEVTLWIEDKEQERQEIRFDSSSKSNKPELVVTTTADTTPPTSDTTAPTFSSAATSTDGTKVILTYNETLSSAPLSADDFTVKVDDSTATISRVATSGSNVELTLSSAVKNGQTVTVAYTDPSSNNDNNAIQDAAGNDASNLSTRTVTNQVRNTSRTITGPRILGTAEDYSGVRGVLLADIHGVGDLDQAKTTSYQWLANGNVIAGATNQTLDVGDFKSAIENKEISVQLTYTNTSGQETTVTSAVMPYEGFRIVANAEDGRNEWSGTSAAAPVIGSINPYPFVESYSNNGTSSTDGTSAGSAHNITAVKASDVGITAREGDNIIRIYADGSKSNRSELAHLNNETSFKEGEEYYFSGSFFAPKSEWDPVTEGGSTVITQLKQYGGGDPNFELRLSNNGDYKMFWRAMPHNLRTYQSMGSAIPDAWNDLKIYTKHSQGSDGIFQVWLNNERVVNYSGATMYRDAEGYLKFGMYTQIHDKRIIYWDAIDISDHLENDFDTWLSSGDNLPALNVSGISDNQQFTSSDELSISGSAIDPAGNQLGTSGGIQSVDLFLGDIKIQTTTDSDFSFSNLNLNNGKHNLRLVATDTDGNTAEKDYTIWIGNKPAEISIKAPDFFLGSFNTDSDVALTAIATDSDGSIGKVEFLANDQLIGTASEGNGNEYSLNWRPSQSGAYSIQARATDNQGAVTLSDSKAALVGTSITNSTLTATQDVTIIHNSSDTGNWSNTAIYGSMSDPRIALVEFNLSNISSAKYIQSAAFKPYVTKLQNAPGTFSIYAAGTENWSQTSADWYDKPSKGKLLDTITISSTNQYASFDVTEALQDAINAGQTKITLWIEDSEKEQQRFDFASESNTSINKPAQLVISSATEALPAPVEGSYVLSSTPDTTAPSFQSAATSTDGTKVILTYNETLSSTTAVASAFFVTTDGNANAVTAVAVSGSTVELTLTNTVKKDQTVTVAYTDPSSSNDSNAIQDPSGNDASSLSTNSVTNTSTVEENGPKNEPPSALILNNTLNSLPENSSTNSRIKLADIAITDDDLGTNLISLAGPGASSFEVEGSVLFLKAGAILDFETQATYSISLTASDPDFPGTTPVTVTFSLAIEDLAELPQIQSIDDIKTQKKISIFQINTPLAIASKIFNEIIVGTKKKDKITGTSEGEILAGMQGKDLLKGGDSADGFLFNQLKGFGNKHADKIKDFDSGEGDSILLDNYLFGLDKKIKLKSETCSRTFCLTLITLHNQKHGSVMLHHPFKQKGT